MTFDYSSDVSRTYDTHRSFRDTEMARIVEFAAIDSGMRVLDVGCGTGNAVSQLRNSLDVDVVGIDKSAAMLEVAKSKSVETVRADVDGNPLPFRSESFDVVMTTYVLHHIHNLSFLFSECHRVLRNGTLVLLTSSHAQIEGGHAVTNRFFPSFIAIDKARFPDVGELRGLLQSAGFADVEECGVSIEGIPIDQSYLEKVKAKHLSTFHLLPEGEFELGVAGLEAYIGETNPPETREWRGTLIRGRKNPVVMEE